MHLFPFRSGECYSRLSNQFNTRLAFTFYRNENKLSQLDRRGDQAARDRAIRLEFFRLHCPATVTDRVVHSSSGFLPPSRSRVVHSFISGSFARERAGRPSSRTNAHNSVTRDLHKRLHNNCAQETAN